MSGFPVHDILARPDAVNVAYMVECCRVLGPGERFALWVQGCPLRCSGCHNPQFLSFRDAEWISVNKLATRVKAVRGIEGLSLLGGEPFVQSQALASLSRCLRGAGLTIMAYSGFTLEELQSNIVPHARELLGQLDLLLDGPYLQNLPTSKPWRGSDNQRLIALSDRYREIVNIWNLPIGQDFEVRFLGGGQVEFVGIPPADVKRSVSISKPGPPYAVTSARFRGARNRRITKGGLSYDR